MGNQFDQLSKNDVVSVKTSDKILVANTTFKVSELFEAMKFNLKQPVEKTQMWLDKGVDCEVLSPSKGWQKGRIRICLEFCPDVPEVKETPVSNELEISQSESPLADIRQMVTENHQQSNS